jgi:hypothetical protein
MYVWTIAENIVDDRVKEEVVVMYVGVDLKLHTQTQT